MNVRGQRKELVGTVISDKMEKTVVVQVKTHVIHPRYGKVFVRRKNFKAHDEKQIAGIGDFVRVQECRPLSKTKRWTVKEILREASTKGLVIDDSVETPKKSKKVSDRKGQTEKVKRG